LHHPPLVPLGITLRSPSTQSTEYEVGETISTSAGEDDTCYESLNACIEVHNFDTTLVGRSYKDVVVTVLASPDMSDNISPNPLDALHVSSLCSLLSPSPECCNMFLVARHDTLAGDVFGSVEPLGAFRGYDSFLDPYSLYLENMATKILLTFAFNHSTNFSKACDKFRSALTVISRFIFKCIAYIHLSYMLRCLIISYELFMTSERVPRVLRCRGVADAPHASHDTILRR